MISSQALSKKMNFENQDCNLLFLKLNLAQIYSVIIGLYPLLGVYASPVPRVDLGTFLLLIVFVFLLSKRCCRVRSGKKFMLMPMLLYIVLVTPVSYAAQMILPSSSDVAVMTALLRYMKFVVSIGVLMAFGKSGLDSGTCLRTVRVVVYASTIMVVIQHVVYKIMGIVIENPILDFSVSEAHKTARIMFGNGALRPSAIFLEPSQMSEYFLVFYCFVLFSKIYLDKHKSRDIIITMCGIVLTGSGVGILSVVAMTVYWLFITSDKKIRKAELVLFGVVVLFVLIVTKSSYIITVMERLFTSRAMEGNAVAARFGGGLSIWRKYNILYQWIGTGYGNAGGDVYWNGYEYILGTTGVAGVLVLAFCLIRGIQMAVGWKKMLLLMFTVLAVGVNLFTADQLIYFFSLIECENRINERKGLVAYG